MIPIATMTHTGERSPTGVQLEEKDKVYVVGYVTQRERPMAMVMHPTKGFHMVELWALKPAGWRTSGVP